MDVIDMDFQNGFGKFLHERLFAKVINDGFKSELLFWM